MENLGRPIWSMRVTQEGYGMVMEKGKLDGKSIYSPGFISKRHVQTTCLTNTSMTNTRLSKTCITKPYVSNTCITNTQIALSSY